MSELKVKIKYRGKETVGQFSSKQYIQSVIDYAKYHFAITETVETYYKGKPINFGDVVGELADKKPEIEIRPVDKSKYKYFYTKSQQVKKKKK